MEHYNKRPELVNLEKKNPETVNFGNALKKFNCS